ncbi:riboflavin synthase [Kineosporia sp. J2-2]|uniref:Riboflavin synthase n=1 Tax=Kineosporia corallincola TaxID=2835133 RepID=A0ABS5TCX7_9ACTN|nr:riboflavin synthase [Kineosporia corallincola]MBT0768910.1 riboflavin synthase [Kineosporia corallincola]
MFTGIVEELGQIVELVPGADSARVTVRGPVVTSDAVPGASIAVNGVCLTVVELAGDTFTADVMAETLERSSLRTAGPGSPVNLERPLKADGRFGGHVVQGHVDGTGAVTERVPGDRWELVRIAVPAALSRYVVAKGSITVDGVSLTVADLTDLPAASGGGSVVTVSLIPETLARTTLGRRAVGEPVNLEVDVLAKYVERLNTAPVPTITEETVATR